MDESTRKMLQRIAQAEPEFIALLKNLRDENYAAFLAADTNLNDVHKGFGLCLKKLLLMFSKSGTP